MSKLWLAFPFLIFLSPSLVFAQNSGDFRSIASGNWNDLSTWETYNGASWVAASGLPGNLTDVHVEEGHTITLTANAECYTFNIERDNTSLVTGAFTLEVSGKLRCYNGSAPGSNTNSVPNNNTFINTSGGGKLRIIGSARDITESNQWNDGPYGFTVEFAIDASDTCRLRSGFSAGDVTFTSGTVETRNGRNFFVNNGSAGTGSITIASGGVFIHKTDPLQRYDNVSANSDSHFGSLVVEGSLVYENNAGAIDAATIDFSNGTLVLTRNNSQTFPSAGFSSGSATPNTFNNVTLRRSSAKSMQNDITINGTLKFEGTTTSLSTSIYTLTFGASATLEYAKDEAHTIGLEWPAVNGPHDLIINQSTGVTMGASRSLDGDLTFTQGVLTTTSSELLTLGSSSTVSGASASQYVNGPLAWTYASASAVSRTFPIGSGSAYRPVVLNLDHDAATATTYTVTLNNSAPTSRTLPAGFSNVSSSKYFNVAQSAGASIQNGIITLAYEDGDGVSDNSALRIGKENGSAWDDLGGTGTAPTSGTITSTNNFTSVGDFVLANVDAAPTTGDLRSKTSGNWNANSTWEEYDGSGWVDADNNPGTAVNVFIQSGHTITCNGRSRCLDLNINTESSTKIITNGESLRVRGKLRAYTGSAPGADALPPTSSTWIDTSPGSGGGAIRFNGDTRDLTIDGEWGAGPSNFNVEFRANSGEVLTLNTHFRAGNIEIQRGTVKIPAFYSLRVDEGSPGTGDITIDNGAFLETESTRISQNGTFANGTHIGSFIVNGQWTITGGNTVLGAATVEFNNTVRYTGVTGNVNLVNQGNMVTGTTAPHTYENVQFFGDNRFTLPGDITVNGVLTLGMTPGVINLQDNNLTIGSAGSISGSFTSENMVATSGSGELRKVFGSAGGFTFPVGDLFGTAGYSPITIDFNSGSFGGYAGVRVTNQQSPNSSNETDYIERYWNVSTTITSYSADVTMSYLDSDVKGTEANMQAARYTGSSWVYGSNVSTGANTAAITGQSALNIFSAQNMNPAPPPRAQDPNMQGKPSLRSDEQLNIFPNPFQDRVTLQATGSRQLQYELYDLNGKKLKTHQYDSNVVELNTSDLPVGVYLLRVTTDQRSYIQRIVKR